MRLPSRSAVVVLTAAALLCVVGISHGISDSDYFWHLTTGRLIADTAHVPTVDPYSFTWAGQAWTPHEWLGELLIYGLNHVLGETGMVIVFGLIAGSAALVAGTIAMASGVSSTALVLPMALLVLTVGPSITIRPQVISWLLLAFLLWLLTSLNQERRARVWLVVPLFALWANLHGLYVIGLGVLMAYAAFTFAGATPLRSSRLSVVAAAAAAILASALTPAGPAGLLYPLRYVDAGDWGLANIFEWQSPNFHQPGRLPFLALLAVALLVGNRGAPGWLRVTAIGGLLAGLLAVRNIPLAGLVAAPVLALQLQSHLLHRAVPRFLKPARARVLRMFEIGLACALVLVTALAFAPRGIGERADAAVAADFPVGAVDALEVLDPEARVFASYGWGGYLIYRLYDRGGRVFVDGRNDMYSDQILEDYITIRDARDGWKQLLERYQIGAILLPPHAAVLAPAETDAGWCTAYRDDVAVLLLMACPR